MDSMVNRLRCNGLILAGLLLVLAVGSQSAVAQRADSFEGDTPRWRLVESDCEAQLTEHEISMIMPRSGRACELLEVACSSGTQALMAYPIEPAAVLDEFQPSLWVRCAAGNIRLGVRVVFPNAVHPVSENRLTTVLWGDTYTQTGSWQRLQIGQLAQLLQRDSVTIRNEFDQTLDLEQPYIDSLVLNVYTGPGRYRVQLDDLELAGMIPLASIGVPLHPNWRQRWRWRENVETRFTGNNSFPIWLQHRGEEPAWVGSLGFTGLLLADVPSPSLLSLVQEAGLSAVSPVPDHAIEFEPQQLSALKGWLIGVALNREQSEAARERKAVAERLPTSLRRPLIGEALEQFWLYSRMASEVIVPSPDPASAGDALSKRQWLERTIQSIDLRSDSWVSVQVGPGSPMMEQCRTAMDRIAGQESNRLFSDDPATAFTVNPTGLRQQVAAAVMCGAKSILYRTSAPLTDPIGLQTTEDRAMQAAMRWSNNDLRLWSPWIQVGQKLPPPHLNRLDYSASRLRSKDADLILVQNVAAESQWCQPPTRGQPLMIRIVDGNEAPQVVRLTEGSVELMTVQTLEGRPGWQVDRPNALEVFVVTRNPRVLSYLRRTIQSQAAENAADQMEIASYCSEQASQLLDARIGNPPASSSPLDRAALVAHQQRLSSIQRRLEAGWQALQLQRPQSATAIAMEVLDSTNEIIHDAYRAATTNLATPQSSPFVLSPGTLKYHWIVADACGRGSWQALQIPGSQFTSLAEMLENGWTQQRRLVDATDLRVELVPESKESPGSLRLAAYSLPGGRPPLDGIAQSASAQTIPGGYEGASLRVRSASFPVKKGQFVRITAQAFIRHIGPDLASGVLFYDNQAGPSLGQLIHGTGGERVPIELYRFAVADGDFRILAECRGECDIQIERLTANVIEPATLRRSFVTAPLEGMLDTGRPETLIDATGP